MKSKVFFLAGIAVGYVLGARAGRGSYEKLKASATRLWEQEPVQDSLSAVQDSLKVHADTAVHKVVDKVLPRHVPERPQGERPSRTSSAATGTHSASPDTSDGFSDGGLNIRDQQNWTVKEKPV